MDLVRMNPRSGVKLAANHKALIRATRGANAGELDRPNERAPMLTLLSMACSSLLWLFCVDLNRQGLAAELQLVDVLANFSPWRAEHSPPFPPRCLQGAPWQSTRVVKGKNYAQFSLPMELPHYQLTYRRRQCQLNCTVARKYCKNGAFFPSTRESNTSMWRRALFYRGFTPSGVLVFLCFVCSAWRAWL